MRLQRDAYLAEHRQKTDARRYFSLAASCSSGTGKVAHFICDKKGEMVIIREREVQCGLSLPVHMNTL
jgi:hypothetical protein